MRDIEQLFLLVNKQTPLTLIKEVMAAVAAGVPISATDQDADQLCHTHHLSGLFSTHSFTYVTCSTANWTTTEKKKRKKQEETTDRRRYDQHSLPPPNPMEHAHVMFYQRSPAVRLYNQNNTARSFSLHVHVYSQQQQQFFSHKHNSLLTVHNN